MSMLSPTRSLRLGSMASTLPRLDLDDGWSVASPTSSVPPTPIRQLTLTDPPPELEVYWAMRRPLTRDMDLERMDQEQLQWPLR
jgi:hypothetical protein